jgi:hypothetical protein
VSVVEALNVNVQEMDCFLVLLEAVTGGAVVAVAVPASEAEPDNVDETQRAVRDGVRVRVTSGVGEYETDSVFSRE